MLGARLSARLSARAPARLSAQPRAWRRAVSSLATLPVVDVAALVGGGRQDGRGAPEEQRQAAALALDRAFTDHGFCYVAGHGIPAPLLQDMLQVSREFFALPDQDKDAISIRDCGGGPPVRGYQALRENVTMGHADLHEAIDFYCETLPAGHEGSPLAGRNKFPARPQRLEAVVRAYVDAMLALGHSMVGALAAQRPALKALRFDESFWVLRSIRYEPQPSAQENLELGCGSHTDYGCFTFVNADDVPGCLQVSDEHGAWHDVPPVPGALVCNIGDMLSLSLGGAYRSTAHRVLSPVGERDRVSCPFFFEPNYDCVVGSVMYGKHLEQRVLSNFATSPNLLKDNLSR